MQPLKVLQLYFTDYKQKELSQHYLIGGFFYLRWESFTTVRIPKILGGKRARPVMYQEEGGG